MMAKIATMQTKPQCPNCGAFKLLRPGKWLLWGGLGFALISLPWTLILIGIPGVLLGLVAAVGGFLMLVTKRNPLHCRACHWSGELEQ